MYITYLSIHLLTVCLCILTTVDNAARNIEVQIFFFEILFSFPLDMSADVRLMGYMVVLFLIL